ncbi:MAG: hypothetical protein ALECFALPRED_006645 [Alectoria fallacina]|uniref:Asl1-like glycosyl hydrolase catalytic domain-containing protein n=1 Tax=Alectoria fallacina TaxID=1903189 RepID=A0A8H3G3M8_9LECA|nr:MAG: hypothetical protein ALECFALPRED_006645 [Alectoria fallacina]
MPSLMYCQSPATSSKRGLVYVPNEKYPLDDANWDSPTSDLTWYYNYASKPSPAFANFPKLQFVPMLWGTGNSSTFLSDVSSQIKAGDNITYVLGFNEPDGDSSTGGSDIPAETAAQIWMQQIEPLARQGVKLGAPACTGAETGLQWTQDFFTACSNCTIDFIPVHVSPVGFLLNLYPDLNPEARFKRIWYSNFQGLASHIGEYVGTFNKTIWVTEFADANVNLQDSQTFYNQSTSYLDRTENVTHYSYFGAFRSDVSNIGANSAMLTQNGKLTDIGSWYLGGDATGNVPKGAADRKTAFFGSGLLVGLATMWCVL